MTYAAPCIDASGLHVNTYQDILDALVAGAQGVFGADIYLGNDAPDYEFLSILALKIYDTEQTLQLAYNNRSPVTAVGSGLDAIVKMNGIARKSASYSTCIVTIAGTAGTIITSGLVTDKSGNSWALPSVVIIPSAGTIDETATCQTIGAIAALAGDLSTIGTPTKGWTSVTNAAAAITGQPVETDAQLRARQAISVALPSSTRLAGTIARIAALSGVTRYAVYENPTGTTDSNGLPEHSISCVVEGSTDALVAETIYENKGPGCDTYGTTSEDVVDDNYGTTTTINFYRPSYVPIYAELTVKALAGYTTATTAAILEALNDYINSLQIGEDLTISALYAAAMAVSPSLTTPLFSITALSAGKTSSPTGTTDIAIAFNEVTSCSIASPANITITVT